jgi:hypothetical protein
VADRLRRSPSLKAEHVHYARAAVWVALAPAILLTELKEQVWVVILLSLYANFAGDVAAGNAAKADRHAKQNS